MYAIDYSNNDMSKVDDRLPLATYMIHDTRTYGALTYISQLIPISPVQLYTVQCTTYGIMNDWVRCYFVRKENHFHLRV